jgi:hypothetical protein
MKDGAVQLGDIAGKITTLEVACRCCERRGRLSVARLIAQQGAEIRLPELRNINAGDCPRDQEDRIYDRCGVHYPQLKP